jgi:hypothetical protein
VTLSLLSAFLSPGSAAPADLLLDN